MSEKIVLYGLKDSEEEILKYLKYLNYKPSHGDKLLKITIEELTS